MEQNNRTETAKMVLSFYNSQAGTRCRIGDNLRKVNIISDAIERAGSISEMRKAIRLHVANNPEEAKEHVFTFFQEYGRTPAEPAQAPVAPQAPVSDNAVQYSMSVLEQAVIQLISKTQSEKIESEIMGQVEDKVRSFIKEEYGAIERKVTTVVDGKPVPMQGITHEKFDTVVKFVANNEPVFLVGPAGSGKNELCKQVAEALDLDFYFTNAVTQEYKLTGFTDANGKYQATQFYKAFTEGGLFMLDEMDASIPEVLVILNAALANGYFDFPAPIGFKRAHPNFRVIAAGNTLGHGADFEYVGRNQLDGASLDRFAIVRIDYSVQIENGLANGDIELADFCRNYRKAALEQGLNVIVSYRAIKRLAKMTQLLSLQEALETCLTKGLEKDDLNMVAGKLPDSKYKRALLNIAKEVA